MHGLVWICWESTDGKADCSLECFSLVNKLFHCRMMDFRLFRNGFVTLPRFTGSSNCFCKIIADVFPLWRCADTTECFTPAKWQNVCFCRWAHICQPFNQVNEMLLICSSWLLFTLLIKNSYFQWKQFAFWLNVH